MVFNLFTGTKNYNSNNTKDKTFSEVLIEALITSILSSLITVGFAWIVLQFAF